MKTNVIDLINKNIMPASKGSKAKAAEAVEGKISKATTSKATTTSKAKVKAATTTKSTTKSKANSTTTQAKAAASKTIL